MRMSIDDVGEMLGCAFMFLLMTSPVSLVLGLGIYTALDNADQRFIEKCVEAGATHKACFEVANNEMAREGD